MFDIPGVAALAALAVFAAWLATRARRANNRIVKWLGLGLSCLFSLAFSLAIAAVLVGFYRLSFPPHPSTPANIRVAGTPDQAVRGARFGAACAGCHSPNNQVPLVGRNFLQGGPPAGTMYAANLTPAGEIKDWSDGEIIRAIREGVHKSGRSLFIMPSEVFHNLSDADVQAIVAYLRSQPAVEPNTPPTKLNIIAAFLIGAGVVSTSAQPPITEPIVAPAEGTADYGKYLVSILGCQACHGENLTGRKSGGLGPPGGPNIRVIVSTWSEEGFIRTLRTGADPNNHTLLEGMPWKDISAFASDEDLKAIYSYLHGR